eukprot:5188391-Pleurochrysis_carterae.AAC.3
MRRHFESAEFKLDNLVQYRVSFRLSSFESPFATHSYKALPPFTFDALQLAKYGMNEQIVSIGSLQHVPCQAASRPLSGRSRASRSAKADRFQKV